MDSIDGEMMAELKQRGCSFKAYPAEKDELDLELAMDGAIKAGAREIILLGATGGRLDHTLANVQLLLEPAKKGIQAVMLDTEHRIFLVTKDMPGQVGGRGRTFSALPLTTRVQGVTEIGVRWELNKALFEVGKPYGVSNIVVGDKGLITVERGVLLIIEVLHKS